MGKHKQKLDYLNTGWFRTLLLFIGSSLTILVLTFSVMSIIAIKNEAVEECPKYLVWVFIFSGITRFVSYLRFRNRITLVRSLILMCIDIALGILVIFAKYDLYIFSICGGLYVISIIVSRIFKLVEKHRVRDIILNTIIISMATLLSLALFIRVEQGEVPSIVLIECLIIVGTSLAEVAFIAFSQLQFKTMAKIIFKTFALEILFGLLTLIIAASLILMLYEPKMHYFPDALWYCFAVVTTIGFGDFTAVTPIGRLITVVLGVYGLIVVAVITSIIVNFYNETKGKDDIKEMKKNIEEEEAKKNKKKK